jgi:hypothetical protein
MRPSSIILGSALVVGLTLMSGVIHGRMSGRWGPSRALADAGAELESIPRDFGSWRLQSSEELPDNIKDMLECTGYILRTYADPHTGQRVDVTVLAGPSGPMSVHIPEICFTSQNHTTLEPRKHVSVRDSTGAESEFWMLNFRSRDLEPKTLRVYYGWTTDGRWTAPTSPRFTFATSPHLYKIQLAAYLPPGQAAKSDDPCRKFLHDFVPVVKRCMRPALNK